MRNQHTSLRNKTNVHFLPQKIFQFSVHYTCRAPIAPSPSTSRYIYPRNQPLVQLSILSNKHNLNKHISIFLRFLLHCFFSFLNDKRTGRLLGGAQHTQQRLTQTQIWSIIALRTQLALPLQQRR